MPYFPSEPGKRILEQTRRVPRNHFALETIDSYPQQCLSFHLNHQWYGLSVDHLVAVLPPPEVTRVPRVPAYILGVMNFRGEVLAAIDLKELFELPQLALKSDPAMIVVKHGKVRTGLLVDGVGDLASLSQDESGEEAVLAEKSQTTFFEGTAHWGDVPVTIIRLEGLLQSAGGCW